MILFIRRNRILFVGGGALLLGIVAFLATILWLQRMELWTGSSKPHELVSLAEQVKQKQQVEPKEFYPDIVTDGGRSIMADGPGPPKPPKVPLGSISVQVEQKVIQEGDNLNLLLTICNKVADVELYLCIPDTYSFDSLGYRIQMLEPKPGKTFETLPPVKMILEMRHGHFYAHRFTLKGNESRDFPILLFGAPHESRPSWLPPGTYQIQVMYLSLSEGSPLEVRGEDQIDFHKPLISKPFRLTVKEPPAEQKEAVALAKEFLMTDLVELEPFLKSYRAVLSKKVSPSLEKRVCYHAAKQLLAKSSGAPGRLEMAIAELHKLAKMMLTPGEAEQVHYRLARYYRDHDQPQEALRWAKDHTTPWAEKLRKELLPPMNK